MRQRILFALCILVQMTAFAFQQQERTLTADERQKIGAEVRKTLLNYHDAMRTGGLMAEFAYLDSSADFYWVPPGYTSALTYDSVATILRSSAGMFRSIDHKWESLQIYPLSRGVATYTGILQSAMVDTTGTKTNFRMIESGVMIKRVGGWKILSGQSRVLAE